MAEITPDIVNQFLSTIQGQNITINGLRQEFNLLHGSKSYDNIRVIIHRLVEQKILRTVGNRGEYRVVKQIKPVRVFVPGRERRPIFNLKFPQDRQIQTEIEIADHMVIREGDLITIGGVKSKSKTTLCMNFTAENIDLSPVLMGNEYTVFTDGEYQPSPRFFNRLDEMKEWVNWVDDDGYDKFTLLPVRDDYAEHIIKDKINLIDWINLDAKQLYDISKVLEDCKSAVGRGVLIVAIQMGENATNPRGGQFARDFSDVEILLSGIGDDDILMTIKGVKETPKGKSSIVGKTYAYSVAANGTQIWNFREVRSCSHCKGTGFIKGEICDSCNGCKFIDKSKPKELELGF